MIEPLAIGLTGGFALGALFFAGLWWTVHRGLGSRAAALWFAGSFMLRFAVLAIGLYALAHDSPVRGAAAAVGVILARVLVAGLSVTRRAGAGTMP